MRARGCRTLSVRRAERRHDQSVRLSALLVVVVGALPQPPMYMAVAAVSEEQLQAVAGWPMDEVDDDANALVERVMAEAAELGRQGQGRCTNSTGFPKQAPLAVVTGANKGIGFDMASQLLEKGCHVVLACRNASRCQEAAAALAGSAWEVLDLESDDSIDRFAGVIREKHGRLDILINNAAVKIKPAEMGGKPPMPFAQQARPTLRTNFWGTVRLTEALLPLLRLSPAPRLINVVSAYGQLDYNFCRFATKRAYAAMLEMVFADKERLYELINTWQAAVESGLHNEEAANSGVGGLGWGRTCYSVSKLALMAYTFILAREHEHMEAFKINCVCPGGTKTDMSYNLPDHQLPSTAATTLISLALLDNDDPVSGMYHVNIGVPPVLTVRDWSAYCGSGRDLA